VHCVAFELRKEHQGRRIKPAAPVETVDCPSQPTDFRNKICQGYASKWLTSCMRVGSIHHARPSKTSGFVHLDQRKSQLEICPMLLHYNSQSAFAALTGNIRKLRRQAVS
jgi:hypothetical protein